MGYTATKAVILYCNPYQPFCIHIAHHAWFDEYNSCLPKEYKYTLIFLLLQKDPEIILHN